MTDNLYHTYQLDSTMPTVYLTKSKGTEPIIRALRERRESDLTRSQSISSEQSSDTGGRATSETEGSDTAPLTLIARLILHYSQMVTTMADVH